MTDIKEAAFAVWKAFGSADPDRIHAVLSEDVRWDAPPENATALALGLPSSMLETRDGIVEFLSVHFRQMFPYGAHFEYPHVFADGDTVIFEQRMRAKTIDGRDYDNRYCWVFEMEGRRVRRIREYMDTYGGHRMIFGDAPPRKLVA